MIYFVQAAEGGLIKIGTTLGLAKRLPQLTRDRGASLSVLAIMPGEQAREFDLHRRFSHLRMEGEWFDPQPELLEFIREHGRPWSGIDVGPGLQTKTNTPACERADLGLIATRLRCVQQMIATLADIPEGNWDRVMRSVLRDESTELGYLCQCLPEPSKEALRILDQHAHKNAAR